MFLNNLLSVVYFTCYTNITDNFSYEICQSVMDTFIDPTGDETPTEAQTIIDPTIVVELIELIVVTTVEARAQAQVGPLFKVLN